MSAHSVPDPEHRLNFVIVLTDDQGPWAMPHKMPELFMPNLEMLRRESLELNRFYCASPVCSPARASMMTGRMPSAHGVHDWLVGGRHPDAKPDHFLEGQPTTAELLAEAGYECMMSGKWHVGHSQWPAPGFEHWYAHRFGGGPYYNAPVWERGAPTAETGYITHAITRKAVEFLQTRDTNRPFYLHVNYTAPHTPWLNNHPIEYLRHYRGCEFDSIPRSERHQWARDDFDDAFENPAPHLAGYCASLTAVDDGLGEIRDELERQSLWDNTIILYTSDNGFSCGHHGIWGKGNGTFPLNFWDNSVRVPAIARVPSGPVGATDELVSAVSWHATVCDFASVRPPDDRWGAGKSFAPILRGDSHDEEELVVVHSEYGQGRMITDGRWKLVARPTGAGPTELYDTADDPEELHNLSGLPSRHAIQTDLTTALADWFAIHEREGSSAVTHAISGYGQIHPLSRGRADAETYVSSSRSASLDGSA